MAPLAPKRAGRPLTACWRDVTSVRTAEAPAHGRGFGASGEDEGQWAQPPAFVGEPSVLKDEPQAQLLTALGLLIAKPEPISEST